MAMMRVMAQPRPGFAVNTTPAAVLWPASRHTGSVRPHATKTSPLETSIAIERLLKCSIQPVQGEAACTFGDAWRTTKSSVYLLVFFTHWADLGSLELAQRLVKKLPALETAGVQILGVGLGSKAAGAKFAEVSGFPANQLYADAASACHKTLGYSPGFLGESSVNGYIKIFPMLAGIGSPGTMQEVIRGYVGDRNAKQIFASDTLMGRAFGVLGDGYQRPFELATVRLNNMVTSLSNWSELAPEDTQQLVQQGGSILIKGQDEVLFQHADSGILKTTNVEEVLETMNTLPTRAADENA